MWSVVSWHSTVLVYTWALVPVVSWHSTVLVYTWALVPVVSWHGAVLVYTWALVPVVSWHSTVLVYTWALVPVVSQHGTLLVYTWALVPVCSNTDSRKASSGFRKFVPVHTKPGNLSCSPLQQSINPQEIQLLIVRQNWHQVKKCRNLATSARLVVSFSPFHKSTCWITKRLWWQPGSSYNLPLRLDLPPAFL